VVGGEPAGGSRVKRPTIADIARRAGVTKAAVSFALNGQPGVSELTRQKIVALAAEMGWQRSSAARALSDGKAGAFGLVVDRPARMLGVEPFFMRLIAGMQVELSRNSTALLFTVAEDQEAEIATYRSWWGQRRVDGVFLVDLRVDDRRVPVLRRMGMPTVVIGSPLGAGGLPAVWADDAAAIRTAAEHLAGLGHRRVARVAGPPDLWHTRIRDEEFARSAAALGMEAVSAGADYSGERAAEATRELLGADRPPTAILYDNDVMAISGLTAAQRLGVRVPEELSIIAWDDSPLCEGVHPALTALTRDIPAYGSHAAQRLAQAAGGAEVGDYQDVAPVLTRRDSTARPPRT
jgi:DNA-binding LacI/PurR family transcriptional regulator